nr:hypothetical protein [Planctomycetota bacterium]
AYGRALAERYGERTAVARLKQLVKYYRAGDLFTGRDDERQRLLRVQTLGELTAGFAARAAG